MKLTALFNKIQARDPRVFPPCEVLRMATIEGAQAVGLGDEVGSLEAGTQADLMRWRPQTPALGSDRAEPLAGAGGAGARARPPGLANLTYAGSGHEAKTVMVAGKALVRDGKALVADETAARAEAQEQAGKGARRVTADPKHKEMALSEAMEAGQLQTR